MIVVLAAAAESVQVATESHGLLSIVTNCISIVCIVAGLFFVLGGTLGVLRLPDFFTRLHAAGMTDTLGAELILLGLIVQEGFTQLSLKFFLVAILLFLTSPTATHAVANAAYQAGLKPLLGKYKALPADQIGKEDE